MRTITLLVALAVALTLGVAPYAAGQEDRQVNDVSEFMQVKLVHAQKVLEGLTMEDYEAIATNAQKMSLLSQAATWRVLQTPEYLSRSMDFRRAADQLRAAAQKKNLDGATLAYVDVTLKCVECHKYVRRVKTASLEPRPSLRQLAGR